MTKALLSSDHFELCAHTSLASLSEEEVVTLLDALILPVYFPVEADRYQLLVPMPMFELLKSHPCASRHTIALRLYDQPEKVIPTLLFQQAALLHRVHSSSLLRIAQRLHAAKSLDATLRATLPTKSTLSQLAGVSPSAIRLTTSRGHHV